MDKQLLRDFITTRPALQELLKEALKEQPVPATPKMYQIVKDNRHNEETASTNRQNNQLVSKWQNQIHA